MGSMEMDSTHMAFGRLTRSSTVADVSGCLGRVERRLDHFDCECDVALEEIRRLARWVDGRAARNQAAAGAAQ